MILKWIYKFFYPFRRLVMNRISQEIHIRPALVSDVESIMEIYNEAILTTTATFDQEPRSLEDRMVWYQSHDKNLPILVAEADKKVIGYASLSHWADKKAYDVSAEVSLYVFSVYRNLGVGKKLMKGLLELASETPLYSLLSRITAGNEASLHLHSQNGFYKAGVLKHIGKKFGKILDVVLMQKILK